MEINSNSQINLLSRISQTIIDSIDDLPIDIEPNRIKEKKESLNNTLVNRLNIPINTKDENKSISSKKDETNKNLYNIVENGFDLIEDGNKKPINVKDTMLENIRKKVLNSVSNKVIKNDYSISDDSLVNRVDKVSISVDDVDQDIDELMNQLDSFKNILFQKTEKVKKMKDELEKSDMDVQKLSVQFTEAEKKFRDAESKNVELKHQIILKLNSQKELLASRLVNVENMETKIKEKKESNNAQIKVFNEKIDSLIAKTNDLNQEASRKEEMLSSIDGKYIFPKNDEISEPIKKVA